MSGHEVSGHVATISPLIRRSPYFAGTEAAGCRAYDHSNHMFVPADYGHDPLDEYIAMTQRASLYDAAVQRQIQFKGKDAERLADYLLTRDLRGTPVGACKYGFVCWPNGIIITDTIVMRMEEDCFWLSPTISDMGLFAQGIAHAGGYDVNIREMDYSSMHIEGPRSRDILRDVIGAEMDEMRPFRWMKAAVDGVHVYVSRTGYSNELAYEVYSPYSGAMTAWHAVIEAGEKHGLMVVVFVPARPIEAGLCMMSYATNSDDRITPLSLWKDFVDWESTEFIGKTALERIISEGGPTMTQVGLLGTEANIPAIEDRWTISRDGNPVGHTRWVVWSFGLGRNIGLAFVEREHAVMGNELTLEYPGGAEVMSVVDLPFVIDRRRD